MQVLSGNGSDCLFGLGGHKTREPGVGGSRRGAGGRGAAHEQADDALPCLHAAQLQGSLHSGSGFRARVQFCPSEDETCPVSTGGGTRRVQLVREGGGGGSGGGEGGALLVARRRGYSARAQAACPPARRGARLLDPLARSAGVPQVDLSRAAPADG